MRRGLFILLAAACTKPVPVAQDAGPSPLGLVAPDRACPGAGCEDGAQIGDLLIGADGLKAVVRQKIAGDVPATYTGDGAWRVMVRESPARPALTGRAGPLAERAGHPDGRE